MAKRSFVIALILTLVANTVFVSATSGEVITIEAENYGAQNGCTVVGDALTMPALADATYNVTVTAEGRYALAISTKAESKSFINISLNGEAFANAPVRYSDNYIDSMIYVNLPTGTHQIKFFVAGDAVTVDKITVTKVTDNTDADVAFLEALNTAKSENEVLSAFEDYGASLGINLNTIIQDVDYKKAVYMNMVNRGFDNIGEAVDTLLDITEREKHDPSIQLQKDGEWVKEAASGNLSLIINNSRIGERPAFAALYKGNDAKNIVAIDKATLQDNGAYKADFGNVEVNGGDTITWQVFFFTDLETIRPYEPYWGVYKELYVATNGNDTNGDGTQDNPFATIGKAKDVAEELSENMWGDIIINIAAGEYFIEETEVFDENNGGKNGFDIVYRGASEGETVISGGKNVTGWTEGENGIWSATVDFTAELGDDFEVEDIRNLYINGIAAERSRSEWRYTYLEDYNDESTSYENDGFVTSTTGGFPSLIKPQYAETVWEVEWRCQRFPIEGIIKDGERTIVKMDSPYFYDPSEVTDEQKSVGHEYYIENDLALLDTEGEFYYDREDKKIYYYPYEDENLTTASTVVALTEGLIKIEGDKGNKLSNLVFDNISFKYGAWNHVSAYGLAGVQSDCFYDPIKRDESCPMLMLSQFEIDYAENLIIKNCEFSSLGSVAVSMKDGVEDVLFEGNVIKDVSGTGIIIGRFEHSDMYISSDMEICQNIDIRNNVLRRIATEYRQNCGISVYYENAINIEHNDILGTPYTGISVGWGWENLEMTSKLCRNLSVTNNKVVDVLGTLSDGGNIYNLGSNYEGKITGNYFAKNNSGNYPGIYLDAGSSYMNVHDNLVLDNKESFLFIQRKNDSEANYQARYNKVYNNHSDTVAFKQSGTNTEDTNIVEYAIEAYNGDMLTAEAQEIYDAAGLETEYLNLLSMVSAPDYIREYIKTTPKGENPGGIRIDCEDYISKSGGILEYGDALGVNPGSVLTYSANVKKAGYYEISLMAIIVGSSPSVSIALDINEGKRMYNTQFMHSDSHTDEYERVLLSEIYLERGENTIELTFSGEAIHVDYMVISDVTRAYDVIPIEAENYKSISNSANDETTKIKCGFWSWQEYDVYSYGAKTYDLYIYGACRRDVSLSVTVNGNTAINNSGFNSTGSNDTYTERKIGSVALNNGWNTLKIENGSFNTMYFDKFFLTEVV